MASKSRYLKGRAIIPEPIPKDAGVVDLVYSYFQAYNAGWLREACQLFAKKYLDSDVTVGMTITGALTPAGLGGACIVPLM
jgi:deoxyhypusine synthase